MKTLNFETWGYLYPWSKTHTHAPQSASHVALATNSSPSGVCSLHLARTLSYQQMGSGRKTGKVRRGDCSAQQPHPCVDTSQHHWRGVGLVGDLLEQPVNRGGGGRMRSWGRGSKPITSHVVSLGSSLGNPTSPFWKSHQSLPSPTFKGAAPPADCGSHSKTVLTLQPVVLWGPENCGPKRSVS